MIEVDWEMKFKDERQMATHPPAELSEKPAEAPEKEWVIYNKKA
ncbi:hypothetical protein [Chitinophaga rhizosphaerae]|nr:hypothetical protein [Chitinophaga rhizosphaerae]